MQYFFKHRHVSYTLIWLVQCKHRHVSYTLIWLVQCKHRHVSYTLIWLIDLSAKINKATLLYWCGQTVQFLQYETQFFAIHVLT